MKRLFLSLLRIGDYIQHESILIAMREEFPQDDIHVVINDVSYQYVQQLGRIPNVHVFPRNRIQKILVEEGRPKENAFYLFQNFVDSLNDIGFDETYNLSHTSFSARLMDLLRSPVKRGAQFLDNKVKQEVVEGNRTKQGMWPFYLNEIYTCTSEAAFQLVEAMAKSLGLDILLSLTPPKKVHSINKIAFQIFSSESSKEWPIECLRDFCLKFHNKYPQVELYVLGAPFEVERLKENLSDLSFLRRKVLGWKELGEFLLTIDLFVSVDTSVQHLAARLGVPLLSLYLGRANPFKFSPQQEGAFIVHGQTIEPEELIDIVVSLMEKKRIQAKKTVLYQTRKMANKFTFLERKGCDAEIINQKKWLQQLVWQLYLDKAYLNGRGPYDVSAGQFVNEFGLRTKGISKDFWLWSRQKELEGSLLLSEIELKLIKSILIQLDERNSTYASGF